MLWVKHLDQFLIELTGLTLNDMKLLFSTFFLFFLACCSKEDLSDFQTDNDGVVLAKPILWKTNRHAANPILNNGTNYPIYHNGNIIIHTTNGDNNRRLTMLNSDNGEIIWHWDDLVFPESTARFIDISFYHQYGNNLIWQTGRRTYNVNLDNGNTIWKINRDFNFQNKTAGNQDSFYLFGQTQQIQNFTATTLYKGHISSYIISEYITPDYSMSVIAPGNRIGDVTDVNHYSANGINYLVVVWQEPTNAINDWQTFLGLFNTVDNAWVYEKIPINNPVASGVLFGKSIIYQNKIYANVGSRMVCHDILTGQQIWDKQFPSDFSFSGFVIEEDKIIANCEDTYTYCLNPQTGNQLWRTKSAGTSSTISYLNGVVYFAGGSTGRLHAIEVATGKMLWSINVDRLGEKGGMFSYNGIYVLPASGGKPAKVIALSSLYAYCFEAAK